jgi:hypothetical protein
MIALVAAAVIHAAAPAGKPGAGIVVIDGGTKAGYAVGQEVCFADAAGAKLGCGKVTLVKETTAAVQLSPQVAGKLPLGTKTVGAPPAATAAAPAAPAAKTPAAKAPDAPAPAAKPKPGTAPTPTAKPKPGAAKPGAKPAGKKAAAPAKPAAAGEDGDGDEQQEDEAASSSQRGITGLGLSFVASIVEPVQYDAIGFDPDSAQRGGSPWVSTSTVDSATYGVAFSLRKPWSERVDVVPVFMIFGHEKVRSGSTISTSTTSRELQVETTGGSSTLGLEVHYNVPTRGRWRFDYGGGTSLHSSTANVHATYSDGTSSTRVVQFNSYLHALALDALGDAAYMLGPIQLSAGALATMPLVTLSEGYSGEVDFSQVDLGNASYELKDVAKAVDHRRAFGFRVRLGAEYRF